MGAHLRLRPRKALANDFALHGDPLLQLLVHKVLRDAGLALLVDHEDICRKVRDVKETGNHVVHRMVIALPWLGDAAVSQSKSLNFSTLVTFFFLAGKHRETGHCICGPTLYAAAPAFFVPY